jgi:lysophospholipase L1-like esterase
VKIIRSILAGLALGLLAACGGGGAPVQQAAPAAVVQPAAPALSNIAAFMGDSITAMWDIPQYDTTNPILNSGVSGDTTTKMLARFGAVLSSGAGVVVILGGINDLSAAPDHTATIDNIKTMASMAHAAGIRVILCSVMAMSQEYVTLYGAARFVPQSDIEAFNQQLIDLARSEGYLYADYYDAMLTIDGVADPSLLIYDGLHPNPAGYAVMWNVLAPLLQEDLQ